MLVPLDEIVVFPNMTVTVDVEVGDEERVLLVPRHEGEYAPVGTVAEVGERVRRPGEEPPRSKTIELEREYRAVVEEILSIRGDDGRISAFVRAIRETGALADTAAYAPELTFEQKMELLNRVDVVERLELALELQRERLAELQVRRRIREDVEEGAQKQQREWFLRQQMNSIRKELGED